MNSRPIIQSETDTHLVTKDVQGRNMRWRAVHFHVGTNPMVEFRRICRDGSVFVGRGDKALMVLVEDLPAHGLGTLARYVTAKLDEIAGAKVTMTRDELLTLMLQSIDAALNIAEMYDTSDPRVADRIIAETTRQLQEAVSS